MKFLVIVEEDQEVFGASSPDIDNVFAGGASVEEAISNFRRGVEVLFKKLREEGGALPVPRASAATVEIDDIA